MNYFVFIPAFLYLVSIFETSFANELARGWGDSIEWHTLKDGLQLSKTTGSTPRTPLTKRSPRSLIFISLSLFSHFFDRHKPVMLIIHKTWCGACKALKAEFSSNSDIKEMSKAFVMVNTQDDEEPSEAKYHPDGQYIPRILFIDSSGKVHDEIINAGANPKYKYFYYSADDVRKSMQQAADEIFSHKLDHSDEF